MFQSLEMASLPRRHGSVDLPSLTISAQLHAGSVDFISTHNARVYMFSGMPRAGRPFHRRNHRVGRHCRGHKHNNLHSAHFSHPISSRSLARTFLDDSCVVHCRDFHFMKCFDSTILSRVDQNVLNVAVPAPFRPLSLLDNIFP